MKLLKIASAIALGLVGQVASAGVITVTVDDFSIAAFNQAGNNNRTGTFTAGSGTASTGGLVADFPTAPVLGISVDAFAGPTTYKLGYDGIALPGGATPGSVIFTVLRNNFGGDNGGTANTVNLNGGANTALPSPTANVTLSPYAGGAFSLTFNNPPTRTWDILIDNVSVSFNCATAKDQSISLAQFNDTKISCTNNVPVPGSLALLGLGGLVAGLLSRRRAK